MRARVLTVACAFTVCGAGKISKGRVTALLQTADKSGREPLHIAAYKCEDEKVVEYLISIGAKVRGSPNCSHL